MFRLAILVLSSQFFLISCFIRTNDISGFEENDITNLGVNRLREVVLVKPKDPLWVLNLGGVGLDDLTLRRGSEMQEREFEETVGPVIATLGQSRKKRVKKDNPDKGTLDEIDQILNKQMKKDIIRIVNKFILSARREPDSYLTESEITNEPTLTLFFRGPYTSLVVRNGRYQWNYFIGPNSPLPEWFYHQQANEDTYVVPSSVKTAFYKGLLHMVQMFLGFPV